MISTLVLESDPAHPHKSQHRKSAVLSKISTAKKSSSETGGDTTSGADKGLHGSQGSLSSRQSRKSSSSSGGSRKSQKSVKQAVTGSNVTPVNATSASGVTKVEGMPGPDEYDEDDDYYSGGYYDENGEWVEASGYYDENGDWVETGGYYDENGEWIEYAGYYDENGDWIDVEVPEEDENYYEDPGGDPGGGGDNNTKQELAPLAEEPPADDKTNPEAGYFLANRGVAVFPQTQTAPLQKELQKMESIEGTTTAPSESYYETTTDKETEDSTEMGGDDEDEPMDDSGADFDLDPGDHICDHSESGSDDDHTCIESPQEEISLGSGTQLKDRYQKTELINNGSAIVNEEVNNVVNNVNDTLVNNNKENINLATIMAKREGKQGWNALRDCLKDRSEVIFGEVSYSLFAKFIL